MEVATGHQQPWESTDVSEKNDWSFHRNEFGGFGDNFSTQQTPEDGPMRQRARRRHSLNNYVGGGESSSYQVAPPKRPDGSALGGNGSPRGHKHKVSRSRRNSSSRAGNDSPRETQQKTHKVDKFGVRVVPGGERRHRYSRRRSMGDVNGSDYGPATTNINNKTQDFEGNVQSKNFETAVFESKGSDDGFGDVVIASASTNYFRDSMNRSRAVRRQSMDNSYHPPTSPRGQRRSTSDKAKIMQSLDAFQDDGKEVLSNSLHAQQKSRRVPRRGSLGAYTQQSTIADRRHRRVDSQLDQPKFEHDPFSGSNHSEPKIAGEVDRQYGYNEDLVTETRRSLPKGRHGRAQRRSSMPSGVGSSGTPSRVPNKVRESRNHGHLGDFISKDVRPDQSQEDVGDETIVSAPTAPHSIESPLANRSCYSVPATTTQNQDSPLGRKRVMSTADAFAQYTMKIRDPSEGTSATGSRGDRKPSIDSPRVQRRRSARERSGSPHGNRRRSASRNRLSSSGHDDRKRASASPSRVPRRRGSVGATGTSSKYDHTRRRSGRSRSPHHQRGSSRQLRQSSRSGSPRRRSGSPNLRRSQVREALERAELGEVHPAGARGQRRQRRASMF